MQGDFITRIKSAYNQFTKTERKVADFVLDNPRRALFMSITDLAESCGVGGSMLTAMKAMNKFLRIEPKVRCLPDTHMQAMAASVMGPEDVAVLFSYSGATKDTIHVAELAKQAGATVICVTRFVKSPLTSFSDVTLLSGANEGPFQSGSTSAEISQRFLIDLMYTEYYRRYFKRCSRYNEKSTASVVEKLV